MNPESQRLAEWSKAVRGSSLKRLSLVRPGLENWRLTAGSMSFADVAFHLIEADLWLFRKLADPGLSPMVGRAGTTNISARDQFTALCDRLEALGQERAALLGSLSPAQLDATVLDQRFGGVVTCWWVVVRGNLDHEVHHRGQVVAWLRAAGITSGP
ncbi:MAG TPA: DinB family protein [Thermoanaerobaculia bacterium]|nr:DinB family protein [Thermoanaerobaculia bacterium]